MAHLPIATEAWVCPGCGGDRQFLGPVGHRALRCVGCEGGFSSTFLTREDHEFLKDAGVRAEAYHCLRRDGTTRKWFTSVAEAQAFLADPRRSAAYDADEIPLWCTGCGFVHVVKPEWIREHDAAA